MAHLAKAATKTGTRAGKAVEKPEHKFEDERLRPGVSPWLSLAVIERRCGRQRTAANLNGRLRTTADGLKTAGLASTAIHQRLHKFSLRRSLSIIVRHRPPQSADLAVFLAVSRPPPL